MLPTCQLERARFTLAAVLDLATRTIVAWSMRNHMRSELTVAALMMARQWQRPATGLIIRGKFKVWLYAQGGHARNAKYGPQRR